MFREQLGQRIKSLRLQQGLSQEALCKNSGLSRRFLGQIEQGTANASFSKILEISEALNISLTSLFVGIGPVDDLLSQVTVELSALPIKRLQQLRSSWQMNASKFALIGLRGCGKTTVGTKASQKLNIQFRQTDQELQQKLQMPLDDIFYYYGADQYREYSRRILEELIQSPHDCLIEVGGSLLMDPICFSLLRRQTTLIWLTATPQDHVDRVHKQGDERVFSNAHDYIKNIKTILEQRKPFYEQAQHIIDTSALGEEQTVDLLCELLQIEKNTPHKDIFPIFAS